MLSPFAVDQIDYNVRNQPYNSHIGIKIQKNRGKRHHGNQQNQHCAKYPCRLYRNLTACDRALTLCRMFPVFLNIIDVIDDVYHGRCQAEYQKCIERLCDHCIIEQYLTKKQWRKDQHIF